jgi:hypothetical protein
MPMRRFVLGCVLCAIGSVASFAQGSSPYQPQRLIDLPTAGTLNKGNYSLDFKFFSEGGVATLVGVGLTDRFSIGIGYELMRVIGNHAVRGQSFPGGMLKYRIMEESYYLPGLALGFESQGSGDFYKQGDLFPRFYFKSKGFFAGLCKSYLFLGQPLGFHAEVNYSAVDNQAESEAPPADGGPSNRCLNGGIGLDKSINQELSILAEYDLALDDNHTRNPLRGYLNAAVRWSIVRNLAIELGFKDILENKVIGDETQDMLREVRIVYIDRF